MNTDGSKNTKNLRVLVLILLVAGLAFLAWFMIQKSRETNNKSPEEIINSIKQEVQAQAPGAAESPENDLLVEALVSYPVDGQDYKVEIKSPSDRVNFYIDNLDQKEPENPDEVIDFENKVSETLAPVRKIIEDSLIKAGFSKEDDTTISGVDGEGQKMVIGTTYSRRDDVCYASNPAQTAGLYCATKQQLADAGSEIQRFVDLMRSSEEYEQTESPTYGPLETSNTDSAGEGYAILNTKQGFQYFYQENGQWFYQPSTYGDITCSSLESGSVPARIFASICSSAE